MLQPVESKCAEILADKTDRVVRCEQGLHDRLCRGMIVGTALAPLKTSCSSSACARFSLPKKMLVMENSRVLLMASNLLLLRLLLRFNEFIF